MVGAGVDWFLLFFKSCCRSVTLAKLFHGALPLSLEKKRDKIQYIQN